MAAIPTQNNIKDLIKLQAQVEQLTGIVDVVIKASTAKAASYSPDVIQKLTTYSTVVSSVFGKDGIGTNLLTITDKLKPYADKQISLKPFQKLFNAINQLQIYINNMAMGIGAVKPVPPLKLDGVMNLVKVISEMMKTLDGRKYKLLWKRVNNLKNDINKIFEIVIHISNTKLDESAAKRALGRIAPLKTLYEDLNEIFEMVANMNVPKLLFFKLLFMKIAIIQLSNVAIVLSALILYAPFFAAANISMKLISIFTENLNKIFEDLNGIKITLGTYLKLKLIPYLLKMVIPILNTATLLCQYMMATGGLKDIVLLSIVFNALESVFESIRNTRAGLFFAMKIRRIVKALRMMRKILREASRLRVNASLMIKMLFLQMIMNSIQGIFVKILILTPIMILAIPALLILSLAFWLFKITFKLFIRAISGLLDGASIKAMLKLIIFGALLTIVSVMFLIIVLVAKPVVEGMLWIIGLLLGITIISALLLGIGLLFMLAAPVLPFALIGLGMMILVIGMLFVIALMLKAIQALNIDPEEIQISVMAVIDTAKMVISSIFDQPNEKTEESDKKSGFERFLEVVGGSIVHILKAIFAVAFLATTMIAIFIILLIATMLRILQSLDLDPEKVKKNVIAVIDTAKLVISSLFDQKDKDSEKSEKSWIESVIEFVGGPIVSIIKAIMAIAYLAVILVSIMLIVIIASQLRILQAMDLDETKVSAGVKLVLDSADAVINALFSHEDSDSEESDKDWLGSFLEFIGGPVKIIKAILSIAYLATAVLAIGLVQLLAKQLTDIANTDLPSDIKDRVNNILICADQVVDALVNRDDVLKGDEDEDKKGFLGSIFSGIGDALSFMSSIAWVASALCAVGMVSQIVKHLEEIKNFEKADAIKKNTLLICGTADTVIKQLNRVGEDVDVDDIEDRLELLEDIHDVMEDIGDISVGDVKNIESVTSSYIKLIDSINKMDTTKLQATTGMFKQMTEFSESINGNFDKLADALSEKLLPVLEELKEVMSDVPEKIEKGFQDTSASIAATQEEPSLTGFISQIFREKPEAPKEEVEKEAEQRLTDRAKADANGIASKLDQLISLLKGQGGQVKVKTI